jgi:hypothetical protein
MRDGELRWYSCDACSTRLLAGVCNDADGCEWMGGVCAPSGTVDIKCEILSKSLCDTYVDPSTSISGVTVVDAPCFFSGTSDSMDTLCVSQSSLEEANCTAIGLNAVVTHGGGKRRLCDDAHFILGWEFTCAWVEPSYKDSYGSCYTVYYLTGGFFFLFLILFFN